MTKNELKTIVDDVLNTDSVVEGTTGAVNVNTQLWFTDFKKIDEIRQRGVELLRVLIDSYQLTLTARI